jgi:1-pyrroline-5-carboxylate dehydrogenase
VTNVPQPVNEPVHDYAPGSPERQALTSRLEEMAAKHVELTMTIDGEHRMGGGEPIDLVPPHNHRRSWERCETPQLTTFGRPPTPQRP